MPLFLDDKGCFQPGGEPRVHPVARSPPETALQRVLRYASNPQELKRPRAPIKRR
ncbi:hypothetical protein NQZ68_026452 [Dissostichus eleginoides]|nr:hypothetical protein NQZ68_026452 [Dissostichus eleginoides]